MPVSSLLFSLFFAPLCLYVKSLPLRISLCLFLFQYSWVVDSIPLRKMSV